MDYPNSYPKGYLIQSLSRKPVEGKLADYRFGEVFGMTYMGNAEYEFGAFPRFLRRMHNTALESCKVEVVGVTYFAVYDPANWSGADEIKALLEGIISRKVRQKAHVEFPARKEESYRDKVSAWADISNGLFWSSESMSKSLRVLFANSVTYMDSQA